ncbi:MAG: hypothetical protein K9N51_06655 [Candidatus Pacebacteria bacterium]|nr:hypothetical protein [Candidatus Paceibacterota bacterium]
MNTTIRSASNHWGCDDRGSAFLGALFCAFLVTTAAAAMYSMFTEEMHTNKIIEQRIKAQEVATGAAARALAFAATDFNNLISPPATMTAGQLGEGSYTVDITVLGDAYFMIHATGSVGDMTQAVKVYTRSPYDPRAFQRAIFSNSDVLMSGGGSVKCNLENGSHSNANTDMSGHVHVAGNASSVGLTSLRGGAVVDGDVQSGVPRIKFPQLDFDHYYNIAQGNGEVHVGDASLKGTYSPAGGIMWVVGDVHISSHTVIHGALFATGSIHQAGKCDIYQVATLPAMVSRDGNIHLSGQSDTMSGIIFAASGTVDLTGEHAIKGAIIAWGDIFTRGNWGVLDFEGDKPVLDDESRLEILAWEY